MKPSRRHLRNLTGYEKKSGWKYSITCTNILGDGISGVPGSHHAQYIDVLHREHAVVETSGVRAAKAHGTAEPPIEPRRPGRSTPAGSWPRTSPPTSRHGPASWACTTANSATPPRTPSARIWHLPARLARHARQRTLAIAAGWPWKDAFLACWQRLRALPAPA